MTLVIVSYVYITALIRTNKIDHCRIWISAVFPEAVRCYVGPTVHVYFKCETIKK